MAQSTPRVWLITGSSTGFGRAMVEEVLRNGEIAVATLRKPSVLDDLTAKYPRTQLLVLQKGEGTNTWKDYEREPGSRRGPHRRDHKGEITKKGQRGGTTKEGQGGESPPKRPERRDHEGAREEGPPKKAKEKGPPKKAREEGPPRGGSWKEGPPKRKALLLSRRRDKDVRLKE